MAQLGTRSRTVTSRRPIGPSRRPRPRVRVYFGLGSNLGDSARSLRDAVIALSDLPGTRRVRVSRLYATAPVGMADQPEFRNAVVAMDLRSDPDAAVGAIALLVELKRLERSFGRQVRQRWGPREIDLDLLLYGRHQLALDRPPEARPVDEVVGQGTAARLLEVPHREAHERLFVLAPLSDIAPRLVPPGWHQTVGSAARHREAIEGAGAVRAIATWDYAARDWRGL